MQGTTRTPFGQINARGVDVELFSEADECEFVLEAGGPVVKCGYRDLGFVFTFHSCLGLLECVAEVEVGECMENDGSGVRGVRDGTVGEGILTCFTHIDLSCGRFQFS